MPAPAAQPQPCAAGKFFGGAPPPVLQGRWGERFLDSRWRGLALLPWLLWRPLVAVRNLAWDLGLLRQRRLPAPVISVGNLTAGGTGKTPVVALVVELLIQAGRQPAVLSRGYGAKDGVNDEAALVGCPVYGDPDRLRAGRKALAAGADCLVLDDGFQHRRLHRDLDLVCLDASRPWGRSDGRMGRCLPLGYLRESPRALRRADQVILTRCDQVPSSRLVHLAGWLRARFAQDPLTCHHAPVGLSTLAGQDLPLEPSRRVVAACGLGHPAAFTATIHALGYELVGAWHFPDHHAYTPAEAARIIDDARSKSAQVLITTKDAAKWRHLPDLDLDQVLVLTVAARPPADQLLLLRQRLAAILVGPVRS